MFDRIRKLLVGDDTVTPRYPELDERERVIDSKLARVLHQTPEEIRRQARQRALRIEVESMRRPR